MLSIVWEHRVQCPCVWYCCKNVILLCAKLRSRLNLTAERTHVPPNIFPDIVIHKSIVKYVSKKTNKTKFANEESKNIYLPATKLVLPFPINRNFSTFTPLFWFFFFMWSWSRHRALPLATWSSVIRDLFLTCFFWASYWSILALQLKNTYPATTHLSSFWSLLWLEQICDGGPCSCTCADSNLIMIFIVKHY